MKIDSVAVGVLLAVCLAVFASCGLGESKVPTPERGEPITIKGRVWFEPSEEMLYGALGDSCEVNGQSYDLRAGTPVVVKDVAGSTIATGELDPGVIVEPNVGAPHGCRFAFTVENVPVSAYYQIEVADTTMSLSYDDLQALNWTVEWAVGE